MCWYVISGTIFGGARAKEDVLKKDPELLERVAKIEIGCAQQLLGTPSR
jgi:hypothetical protein